MAERVCPVWVGYFLISPIRRLLQNPEKILGPFIKEGMQVLDIGPAMGFFSLPMAKMVGANGKVIGVDIQENMIKKLEKRAHKKGLLNRMELRICDENSFGIDDLNGKVDFALAFAVVHELPDIPAFFSQVYNSLKPQRKLLITEPKGHLKDEDFNETLTIANKQGFKAISYPKIGGSRSVLLEKPE